MEWNSNNNYVIPAGNPTGCLTCLMCSMFNFRTQARFTVSSMCTAEHRSDVDLQLFAFNTRCSCVLAWSIRKCPRNKAEPLDANETYLL